MDTNINKLSSYPKVLSEFRKRLKDEPKLLTSMFTKMSTQVEYLKSVKTVLSFGPGFGEFDLMFMSSCLPALEKCVFVEVNSSNNEGLKKNFKKQYGDKVKFELLNEHMCEFKTEEKFDLVILVESISCLSEKECTVVLNNCFQHFMKERTGHVMTMNVDEVLDASGVSQSALQRIHHHFPDKLMPMTESAHIVREIKKLNSEVVYEHADSCVYDLSYFDDYLTDFFNNKSSLPISSAEMKNAVDVLYKSGVTLYPLRVVVARKK